MDIQELAMHTVADSSRGVVDSLDADTVLRVGDGAVGEVNVLDVVVATSTNGADGETVTTRAVTTGEGDVGTGVDGNAVILVVDGGAGDVHTSGRADVESIGVVAELVSVTIAVVNGHVDNREVLGTVDGDGLLRGVLDVQTSDGRVDQVVGVEKLGLGDTTVGALAVPPLSTVAFESRVSMLAVDV